MIRVDISNVWGKISLPDLLMLEQDVAAAHQALSEAFPAWKPDLAPILETAERLRAQSEVLLVVGREKYCLGARGAIELLRGPQTGKPQLLFAGEPVNSRRWQELCKELYGKDFSVLIIGAPDSPEPAPAARWAWQRLLEQYGPEAAKERILAVSDPEAPLGQLALQEGWEQFPLMETAHSGVPTAAELLIMAAAGTDIAALVQGAAQGAREYDLRSFENPVWLYAAVRQALYRQGLSVELIASFDPWFRAMGQRWQQLFAREDRIFPVSGEFPGQLDSLGCRLMQGDAFETLVRFEPSGEEEVLEETAWQAALETHTDADVPVITMELGQRNARTVGALLYFLALAQAVSARLRG